MVTNTWTLVSGMPKTDLEQDFRTPFFSHYRVVFLFFQAQVFEEKNIGHLSGQTNGYASGDETNQKWPRQQPFSSSADVAYTEDDLMDPLMENWDAAESKGAGEATGRVELPYSTLRQMQLDREDQSHQEACDKYSKVCMASYGMAQEVQEAPKEKLVFGAWVDMCVWLVLLRRLDPHVNILIGLRAL